jgi:Zn-dependent peptidase ImmA (M78 family)
MATFIPQDRMESITLKILHDYGTDLNSVDNSIPIPIEEIIDFHFDLSILWEDIDYLNPDDVVMAAIFPTERKIVMNESQRELFEEKIGTMNFTFAHELGHWVLHASDETQLCFDLTGSQKVFYCRSRAKKPAVEIQADMFAGSLLMPRPFIVTIIQEIRESKGSIQWTDLYPIKDRFNVSISALRVRLEQLNLIYVDKDGTIYASKEESEGQMTFGF